jgi:hypothetical protein
VVFDSFPEAPGILLVDLDGAPTTMFFPSLTNMPRLRPFLMSNGGRVELIESVLQRLDVGGGWFFDVELRHPAPDR